MNLLEKIIEEIKQKAINKNIPYDAFIYQECIEIIKKNENVYEQQIIDAFDNGKYITYGKNFVGGEQYYNETFKNK